VSDSDWGTAALLTAILAELPEFLRQLRDWSFWQDYGFFLQTRWGVLLFLAAMPLVWLFQFLAPRRWWLVFLSTLSLAFIAFTLVPWPVNGALPRGVPLPGAPAEVPLSWQHRAVLGTFHAGVVLTLLACVYGLARVGERKCRQAGDNPRSPLRAAVLLLVVGYFGLYVVRHAIQTAGGRSHALEAWMLFPAFHETGLAFVFVKSVHYVWDSCRGRIYNTGWWRFLCWMTFFPSYRVGPIERYHDFYTQIHRCHRRWRATDLPHGVRRIVQGAAKGLLALFIVERAVPTLGEHFVKAGSVEAIPYLSLWVAAWTALGDVELILAGYTDIAVGLARLMGYRMVENFKWMFVSRNFVELWHRAHISVSHCLRDYCYYPLIRRGPFRRRPLLAAGARRNRREELTQLLRPGVNYYITFMLCGLWHAPVFNWLFWGFCTASGMMVFELWNWFWQRRARQNGRLYQLLRGLRIADGGLVGRMLGIAVTFNFFSVTLLALLGPQTFLLVLGELVRRPFTWIF